MKMFIGYIGKTQLEAYYKPIENDGIIVYRRKCGDYFAWFDIPPRKVVVIDYEDYKKMEREKINGKKRIYKNRVNCKRS